MKLAASTRQDLVVLDVCKLHPLRRIRNGVISRSWSTDRSVLRSHTRSPILLQNRLVESSTQAAINASNVLRSASRSAFLRVVCQEINSSYSRAFCERRSFVGWTNIIQTWVFSSLFQCEFLESWKPQFTFAVDIFSYLLFRIYFHFIIRYFIYSIFNVRSL